MNTQLIKDRRGFGFPLGGFNIVVVLALVAVISVFGYLFSKQISSAIGFDVHSIKTWHIVAVLAVMFLLTYVDLVTALAKKIFKL